MSAAPLAGCTILVTRPRGQAQALARAIESAGGRAFLFPTIEIAPPADPAAALDAIDRLEAFDLAIFVSPNAVRRAFELAVARRGAEFPWPATVAVAAVASGTRRALEALGVHDVIAPEAGHDSEALLALPQLAAVAGKRVVIFRGDGGRALLADTLEQRGAQVVHAPCYRRERPAADPAPLIEAWSRGAIQAVTASSSEGLDNLLALLGSGGSEALRGTPLFVPHARIAEHARQLGVREVHVAGPGDAEVVERLMAYFGPKRQETMESPPTAPAAAEAGTAAPGRPSSAAPARRLGAWVAGALALAAAISVGLWLDTRGRIGATQDEIALRLREVETEVREARNFARQVQETQRDVQARVAQLDARLADSENQQVALEALYQELSRSRDEWQLAETEQVLAIASQQLQLSGNVRAALLALQLAESRLARADRPQFLAVRRALGRDIERLKALPSVDIAGLSLRLDALVAGVDGLPLAFDERTERAAEAKQPAAQGFLARLGGDLWSEIRQLVVVRRVDTPDPPLLAPPQAYFLKENLRLRLLNARMALLMRDEAGYREDLRAAEGWVKRYFDLRAKPTREYLGQLAQFSSTSIAMEIPSISDSLDAVRGFKSRRERGG